jgi:hypothetical protein
VPCLMSRLPEGPDGWLVGDLGNYLVAGGAFLAGIVRYHTARPGPLTGAQRHLLVVLFGAGGAQVFAATDVQAAVAAATTMPYLARFLASTLAMVSTFSAVLMVARVLPAPAQTRSWIRKWSGGAVMVVLIAAMAVLLLGTDAPFNHDFAAVVASEDEVAAGQAVYWGFQAVCITRFIVLIRRYLLRPDVRPLMHAAMVMATAASVLGLVWLVWSATVVVVEHLGGRLTSDSLDISYVLGIGATGLMVLGLTLPLWIRSLHRHVMRWRTRRAVRRLEPFWSELTDLLPEVVLRQPDFASAPEVVLYRRVIEIRDAGLRLMRYVPPDLDARLRAAESDYVRETRRELPRLPATTRSVAAAFAAAMVNFRAHRRQASEPTGTRVPPSDFADLLSEARWLITVHHCMLADPVVGRIVDSVRRT